MKRLYSYADEQGESRVQTVLLYMFWFFTPIWEEEGMHCNSRVDGCGAGWKRFHPSFWASTPSSVLDNVCVGRWELGGTKRSYFYKSHHSISFPKQALDRVVFYSILKHERKWLISGQITQVKVPLLDKDYLLIDFRLSNIQISAGSEKSERKNHWPMNLR